MSDHLETSLSVDVEIDADDDPEQVREVLDALLDGLGLDLTDIEIAAPSLYACIDCGSIVSTNSVLMVDESAELDYRKHGDDVDEDTLVTLSETCPGWGCSRNAFTPLEFGVVVDLG